MGCDRFRFKKFSLSQEKCAMKIGTDGVLLGAWAGATFPADAKIKILDVGAGTGLISLMLAQRFPYAEITALEISNDAAQECEDNFRQSPWNDRLTVICGDFSEFSPDGRYYNLIVSNPPFFTNGIVAPAKARAAARHAGTLSPVSLIERGASMLAGEGVISLVTPLSCKDDLLFAATLKKLSPTRLTEVRTIHTRPASRLLSEFSSAGKPVEIQTLTIHDRGNRYDPDYISLTKDFYLDHQPN